MLCLSGLPRVSLECAYAVPCTALWDSLARFLFIFNIQTLCREVRVSPRELRCVLLTFSSLSSLVWKAELCRERGRGAIRERGRVSQGLREVEAGSAWLLPRPLWDEGRRPSKGL